MIRVPLLALALALAVVPPASAQTATPSPSPPADYLLKARQLLDGFDRDRLLAQIRELYEQAKASGERVPTDVWGWAREDLARAGTWEYRVLTAEKGAAELEAQLNLLGRERWECVGIAAEARDRRTIILKRPLRSYLGHLSMRDVLRVLPDRN